MKINSVLIKPILTEKATKLAQNKIYMFHVSTNANKFQIKKTAEKLFSVKISTVTVLNRKGKNKRVGRRMMTKKLPDRKIALLKVIEGNIGLFPQT